MAERAAANLYIQYMYSYPHKTAYRPLAGVFLRDYAHLLAGGGHGMYFHVPFCQAKCGYCNLFSAAGQDSAAADRYLDAVQRQAGQYQELLSLYHTEFSQLVIGGGTPLFLTPGQMERMFQILHDFFRFAPDLEFVIETAPNQTDAQKLGLLKQAGVTRVSMGIQSFQDRELLALGRCHSGKRAEEALNLLKSFDFSCVNVDFIYGIPGQTVDSLLDSLKQALQSEPDEIFLYPLYVRPGAALQQAGTVPDAGAAYVQYQNASAFLRAEGFRQDSMRRFVRDGKNKREFSGCGFGSSLALGCGGRSYLGNLHFASPYAVAQKRCLQRLDDYENTKDYTEITHGILLSEEEIKRRCVIRHVLIRPGLGLGWYEQQFHSPALEDFPILKNWIEEGWAELISSGPFQQAGGPERQETYLALTDQGLGLSDYLGPQLISDPVRKAAKEWEESYGGAYDFIPGQPEKL